MSALFFIRRLSSKTADFRQLLGVKMRVSLKVELA
jgi:hypothetical protein